MEKIREKGKVLAKELERSWEKQVFLQDLFC